MPGPGTRNLGFLKTRCLGLDHLVILQIFASVLIPPLPVANRVTLSRCFNLAELWVMAISVLKVGVSLT
jgi:hypothetical protein